ncbi:MAG: asparagine synthase-related protein [Nitrososphaerales archaeon]
MAEGNKHVRTNCVELRDALTRSVQRNLSNAMLLSGGLDSSIIASIATKFTNLTGITTVYENAPDLMYANIIAEKYPIRHLVKHLTMEDTNNVIENVVRIMKSFDPMEIRNTSVIYSSLKELKDNGFNSIMTGDGGDELFVGYIYMLKLEVGKLESELKKLWHTMNFSSIIVGKELVINVKTPYLDKEFLEFAKRIPIKFKIREQDGTKVGKWILRGCFEDCVTKDVAWRKKMPLEVGAGINVFAEHFNSTISDGYYLEKIKYYASHDLVRIRDKEHLYYYKIYRQFFDAPKSEEGESRCPSCIGCVRGNSRFCRTCGAFPITPIQHVGRL